MVRLLLSALTGCLLASGCATGSGNRGEKVPTKPYGSLDMVILAVEDVKRAASFYDAAFRWPRRLDLPVLVEFELPDGRGLAVYQRESFANNTGRLPPEIESTTGTELYIRCEDLDLCIGRLLNAGARPLAAKQLKPWGDEVAYFADLDGNVVAVARKAEAGVAKTKETTTVLEAESIIYASAAEVFAAWTTEEGVKTFFAPEAHIDLQPGGKYELIFMPDGEEGKRGAEGCTIIEFTQDKHLAFTWSFPPSMPAIRDKFIRVDVRFEAIDPEITEVKIVHTGWQTGHQWFRGMAYFEKAWELVLSRLNHRFRFGPIDWEHPPDL